MLLHYYYVSQCQAWLSVMFVRKSSTYMISHSDNQDVYVHRTGGSVPVDFQQHKC